MTIFKISPVSLRPSGLAESPLFLIGLAERLLDLDELFVRVDDFSRCGMIRTIFRDGRSSLGDVKGRVSAYEENAGGCWLGGVPWQRGGIASGVGQLRIEGFAVSFSRFRRARSRCGGRLCRRSNRWKRTAWGLGTVWERVRGMEVLRIWQHVRQRHTGRHRQAVGWNVHVNKVHACHVQRTVPVQRVGTVVPASTSASSRPNSRSRSSSEDSRGSSGRRGWHRPGQAGLSGGDRWVGPID